MNVIISYPVQIENNKNYKKHKKIQKLIYFLIIIPYLFYKLQREKVLSLNNSKINIQKKNNKNHCKV